MKPGGIFRWRWRLGRFDNAAQVGNALHVLKGLDVPRAQDLVRLIQDEHQGKDTDPRVLWREAKKRLKEE